MIINHLKPGLNSQCCFNGSTLLWAIKVLLQKERNMCSQLSIFSLNGRTIHSPNVYWVLAMCLTLYQALFRTQRSKQAGKMPELCAKPRNCIWLWNVMLWVTPHHVYLASTFSVFLTPPFSVLFSSTHYFVFALPSLCQIIEGYCFLKEVYGRLNSCTSFHSMLLLPDTPSSLPRDKRINGK